MNTPPSRIAVWKFNPNHETPVRFLPEVMETEEWYGSNKCESKANLIAALRTEADRLEKEPDFKFTHKDLERLPFVGSTVWAVKEWPDDRREVLPVEVTEYMIEGGELFVVIGFYYKHHTQVFREKRDAEEFMKTGTPSISRPGDEIDA